MSANLPEFPSGRLLGPSRVSTAKISCLLKGHIALTKSDAEARTS